MKRLIAVCLCVLLLLTGANFAGAAVINEIPLFDAVVAGEILSKDRPILSEKNIWLLPARETCVKLGILNENIKWYADAKKTVIHDNGRYLSVAAGEDEVVVNNASVKIMRAALLYNGCLYLPLDFYENVLECKVVWDEVNGIIYVQRKDVYDKIYNSLKAVGVADLDRDSKLYYEYDVYSFTKDAENGYELQSQRRTGTAEYNFITGECINKGTYTNLGRDFDFENHYRRNTLYMTEFNETRKTSDKNQINEFIRKTLGNAFLDFKDGKISQATVADDETIGFSSMSELEKLSLVLKVSTGASDTEISGSILGIITPLHTSGVVDEHVSYKINNITGKLVKASSKSTVHEQVYGINVEVSSGWSCKYKVA